MTHFYVTITKDFEHFQCFNFETSFLKNENLFRKVGVPFFSCESALFPFKASLSKVNVKTNRMGSKKRTYHKDRSFYCVKSVQIQSFFWSVFFRIRTEYGETLRISPYSVRMRKIRTRKNFQCILILFLNAEMSKIRRDKFSYLKILKGKIHLQIKQYRVLFESVCFHFEYL